MTAPEADKDLVIDEFGEKLAAFQALRKSDTKAADRLLNSLGAQDDVDRDIVLELGARRPLAYLPSSRLSWHSFRGCSSRSC